MLLSKALKLYKRPDVQRAMVEHCKNKEVAIRFDTYFGKRPDVIVYENDILDLAKKKATSFHCSEELWSNPMNLRSEIKKNEMDDLRTGWDLILDIDCQHFIYSKLATHILIKILKDLGIESVTCKFSGNKGFHIAVPFEAFPESVNGTSIKDLFPDAPRRIAFYLREKLKPLLEKAIMKYEKNDISKVIKRTGMTHKKLVKKEYSMKLERDIDTLNAEEFLEIDTVLIAPRHLYRAPYSLHEKSGLVSIPVNINSILKFSKEQAEVDNVKTSIPFLDRKSAKQGEANQLLMTAFDFYPKEVREKTEQKEYALPEEAIREELFPPCMKNMLQGLEDGKKRSLFTMINFLRGAGWTIDMIEQRMKDWNRKNPEPLREVYINGQVRQAKKIKDIIPPHNCKSYYEDLRVCKPDSFCPKIKNPLQYAKLKYEMEKKPGGKRVKLTEEQKEMRRKYREKLKQQKENV